MTCSWKMQLEDAVEEELELGCFLFMNLANDVTSTV